MTYVILATSQWC